MLYLFDWGHKEAPFFINSIWNIKAEGFLYYNYDPPRVNNEWKEFSKRFTFSPGAMLSYGDSNAYAGNISNKNGAWNNVYLFDAHHDCGYDVKSFDEWQNILSKEMKFDCSDWMLVHLMAGSKLHYRSPQWHKQYLTEKPKIPKGVKLDHKPDNGKPLDITFNQVFVCRSGAWVPPWCDKEFMEFLSTWNLPMHQVDKVQMIREFNWEEVHRGVAIRKEIAKKIEQTASPIL